jgi:nitroreductase
MVIAMAPQITPPTFCLDQVGDVLDPVGQPLEVYRRCVQHIRAWSEFRYASCSARNPADVQRVRAMQNVMLSLVGRGLGSCPQYSVAGYGDVIRAKLKLGTDRLIVRSLAVGYADETAPVNRFFPERAPLEDYVQWHD